MHQTKILSSFFYRHILYDECQNFVIEDIEAEAKSIPTKPNVQKKATR